MYVVGPKELETRAYGYTPVRQRLDRLPKLPCKT